MAERPPFDRHRVRVAFGQMQSLVEGVSNDETGDLYRRELDTVLAEAIDPHEGDVDALGDSVAHLLYAASLFGAAALACAEAYGGKSRDEALAFIGSTLNSWLDAMGR